MLYRHLRYGCTLVCPLLSVCDTLQHGLKPEGFFFPFHSRLLAEDNLDNFIYSFLHSAILTKLVPIVHKKKMEYSNTKTNKQENGEQRRLLK